MKKTLIILLMLSGLTVWGQEGSPLPHYRFHLDSTTFQLGDQTVLSIESPEIFPSIDQLSQGDIVALRQWMDSTDGTLKTLLTCFEEGEHWLHIGDDSILLTVNDVPNMDTTNVQLRDIADVMRQPLTLNEIILFLKTIYPWMMLTCIVIIAAILIFLRIKRRKPLLSALDEPPLPADQQALESLEALRLQQLWQQGKVKEYQTDLTDILRRYLEQAHGIPSSEMTSDQTLEAFETCTAHNADTEALLRGILTTADMVKFAKSEPLPYQHDRSMNDAVAFVRSTRPQHTDNETTSSETPNA